MRPLVSRPLGVKFQFVRQVEDRDRGDVEHARSLAREAVACAPAVRGDFIDTST